MVDLPFNDLMPRGASRRVRKLLGRAYLHEDRLEDALEVYIGLLAEDAEDASVLLVLGNLYRLAGSLETAAGLFARALLLDPGNPQIERLVGLALAQANDGTQGLGEETEPLASPAVTRLLKRLNEISDMVDEGYGSTLRAEIRTAADCLEAYLPEGRAAAPGETADTVQQLMPALIEMNIRHARASGRAEMAEALQSLHIHLTRNTGGLKGNDEQDKA